tara:strand:- start:185 stop:493 length:309 start_codon:yes stop_codon:yes gene_type:complete
MHANSKKSIEKSMAIETEMESRLNALIVLSHFEVKDFTGRHLNHELHEGGFHLEAIIVSDDFQDCNLLERHKIVYKAMGDLMKHEIHALSMKTLTTKEWENR